MALLIDSRIRVTTAAGVPISGGKVRVYNAGTTTLTTLYSDSGLTTPLTNPVAAGSDGWCAQIFAAEGTLVDMQTETAAGVVLKTYVNVVFLGSNTGAISRDFLSNGRVTVRGTGGYPNLEFGDATGDDTGGTGRIGGWLGTQADLLTLDAALTNTTGKFKENSKKILGIIYTDVTQVTAQTSVDIALPNDPVGVRQYRLDIWDYSQSGIGNCNARLSFDGGATYPAAAASYNGVYGILLAAGWTTSTFSNTFAQIHNIRGGTNAPARGDLLITTPSSGSDSTLLEARFSGSDAGVYTRWESVNYGPASGRADHIRLLMSSSTFTFKYRLTVLRGSGDA